MGEQSIGTDLAIRISRCHFNSAVALPVTSVYWNNVLEASGVLRNPHGQFWDLLILSEEVTVPERCDFRYMMFPDDGHEYSKVTHFFASGCEWVIDETLTEVIKHKIFRRTDLKKILFVAQNVGAVGIYRLHFPADILHEKYVDVDVKLTTIPDKFLIQWADLVVVQRHTSILGDIISLARRMGKVVSYDTDDLEIKIPYHHPLYLSYKEDKVVREILSWVEDVDLVTVSTPELAQELSKYSNRIKVFLNMIDFRAPMWNYPLINHEDLVIGWVGGSTHYEDLKLVRGWVQSACREVHAKFKICGFNPSGYSALAKIDKAGNRTITVEKDKSDDPARNPWNKIIDMFRDLGQDLIVAPGMQFSKFPILYTDVDMTIAPLVVSDFNNAKSEIKVIESGVFFKPVIAQDVPAYRRVIEHGKNGFLAKDGKEFLKYIKKMADPVLRKEMGKAIGETVRKKYDLLRHIDKRYKVYSDLLNKRNINRRPVLADIEFEAPLVTFCCEVTCEKDFVVVENALNDQAYSNIEFIAYVDPKNKELYDKLSYRKFKTKYWGVFCEDTTSLHKMFYEKSKGKYVIFVPRDTLCIFHSDTIGKGVKELEGSSSMVWYGYYDHDISFGEDKSGSVRYGEFNSKRLVDFEGEAIFMVKSGIDAIKDLLNGVDMGWHTCKDLYRTKSVKGMYIPFRAAIVLKEEAIDLHREAIS